MGMEIKINNDWIKRKLVRMYVGANAKPSNFADNMTRELLVKEIIDYGEINFKFEGRGCLFFVLCGSPPKGYAIYEPSRHFLICIDPWGKKRIFKHHEYIKDKELNEEDEF